MPMSGIGLLNEKQLHASLKEWYAQPGDQFEVPLDGFVIDLVRGDMLLEIQTRGFASVKSKLINLVRAHPVRLIHPIAQEKWIVRLGKGKGEETARRKSPKRGRVEDLFWEMVSFPRLLANPNFSVEVLLTREEEVRRYEERRRRRTRGWVTVERRLLDVLEQRLFEQPADLQRLLPESLEQSFTARDLAEAAGIGSRLAQKMAYCLREAEAIRPVGKRGRANLYQVADA